MAPCVAVPGGDLSLLLVDAYKHLGGEIRADGSNIDVAQGHRKAAFSAYSPLAVKIFGAQSTAPRMSVEETGY